MAGEGTTGELKSTFDPSSRRTKLQIVRHLVALANSGGGTLDFGYTETETIGIPLSDAKQLDGARMGDLASSYVAPGIVRVSHEFIPLADSERVGVRLTVEPSGQFPLVVSKTGDYPGGSEPIFKVGDIYVRHGAKSERADYQDLVQIIKRAIEADRGVLAKALNDLVRFPPGTEVEVRVMRPSAEALNDPNHLLATAIVRRQSDHVTLLLPQELLACWKNRDQLEATDENLDMLLRSAFRRTPTLFLWLSMVRGREEFLSSILLSSVDDPSRDTSDGARAILEVGALVLSDEDLAGLVEKLRTSKYKHFRNAIASWTSREDYLGRIMQRLNSMRVDDSLLTAMDGSTLVALADRLADRLMDQIAQGAKPVSLSQALTNVGRVLFQRA